VGIRKTIKLITKNTPAARKIGQDLVTVSVKKDG